MAKYLALFNWTDQGIRNVKDSVDRRQQATQAFQALGVTIETLYWTMGRYDIMAILDAPDDATLSAALLQLATLGNLRTETLRAFDDTEMRSVLQKF